MIGMQVMITQNFDVESGIVNRCVGMLVSVHYTVDNAGICHAVSCVIYTPSMSEQQLPYLEHFHSIVLVDTMDIVL